MNQSRRDNDRSEIVTGFHASLAVPALIAVAAAISSPFDGHPVQSLLQRCGP
jgi:hypothetical protein